MSIFWSIDGSRIGALLSLSICVRTYRAAGQWGDRA